MPWARIMACMGFTKIKLSKDEYYRLQRAFLFFELYRRLFGSSSIPKFARPDRLGYDYKLKFLSCLFLPMRRELWSVYSYLKSRMSRAFDEIDDFLILKFKKAEKAPTNDHNYREYIDCADLPSARWFIFNSPEIREARMEFLIELGLPFCVHFFTRRIFGQASLALQLMNHRCLEPLDYALRKVPVSVMDVIEASSLRKCVGNAQELADGMTFPRGTATLPIVLKYPSRALNGYYFWDKKRIRRTSFKTLRNDVPRSLPMREEVKRWKRILQDMSLRTASLFKDENKILRQQTGSYLDELEKLEY